MENVARVCTTCDEVKPLSGFARNKHGWMGRRSCCKECIRVYRREFKAGVRRARKPVQRTDRETHLIERAKHLKKCYGLTIADYDRLLERQGGGCAICGEAPRERSLHVDHDHDTDEVRGILCLGCNAGLGNFTDDPARMREAIAYLAAAPASSN